MACIKHFAANSIENTRFEVDVDMDERSLREIYLPHFERCVKAGAASVMSAYNYFRGEPCGHSAYLQRKILKEEWGFDGFILSDFVFCVRNTEDSVNGGMDIEMPSTIHWGTKLVDAVRNGSVREDVIDDAVLRLLRQKIRFAQVNAGTKPEPGKVDVYKRQASGDVLGAASGDVLGAASGDVLGAASGDVLGAASGGANRDNVFAESVLDMLFKELISFMME